MTHGSWSGGKIRALIVDDEYPARAELRFRLSRYPDVEVVGEAATAREALQLVAALDYDVLFLDVHMPGLNGLELARQLREGQRPAPSVVFVTAYDEYAVEAFGTRAVDYLLKPVDDERLAETIDRLREEHRAPRGEEPPAEGPSCLVWIPTEKEGKTIPVALEEVVFISAEGENVFVHTGGESLRTRFTLHQLSERLPQDRFFRCHRSYIVNIYQVREIIPYFSGTYLLSMKDRNRTRIPVSRGNAKRLKQLFGLAG